jgi:protein SCO1/2
MSALAGALAVALTVAGCGSGGNPHRSTATTTASVLHGAVPSTSAPKPEFTLLDTAGHRYDLDARTAGKVLLLYFGYTHCPDECPTSMADVAAALRRTTPALRAAVDVVFVTTDPWRDTARPLRAWLDRFSPAFVGLTGTPQMVAQAEVAVGMPISRRVGVGSTKAAKARSLRRGRYAVDHFAAVLAYDRTGRLATLYPSGVTPADIAADLPVLAKR